MSGGSGGGGGSVELPETAEERQLSKIAVEQWNDYQRRFAPLENRLIGEVRTTPGERDQALGYANAATSQAFDANEEALRGRLFAGGSGPSSGRFSDTMFDAAADEVLSGALNSVDVNQAMSDREVYGLQSAAALGRGQPELATGLFANAANQAQNQAYSDARNSLIDNLSTQSALGTLAGAGAAYAFPAQGYGGQQPKTQAINVRMSQPAPRPYYGG
ncbi:MAG: hypothetical protein L0H83_01385 [Salinisphaera sp.]|nr:hypothetical protein [Salinisphaera sp.]